MAHTKFFAFLKEKEIEYVDFRFTDLSGIWHHLTYVASALDESLLKSGITFDGSSIDGWKSIHDSDMYFIPDVETVFVDPFASQNTAIVYCDVYDTNTHKPYEKDPRTIAKKAMEFFLKSGVGDSVFFGPEPEFFIFDSARYSISDYGSSYKISSSEISISKDDPLNLGHRPQAKGGYFPVSPVDHHFDIRSDMVSVMKECGLDVLLHHHEVAVAQSEIGIKYADLIGTADNIQKYKYIVKNVAQSYGKTATFMPKPIYGDNGSGMHVHQSIWKDGQNLFTGSLPAGLSETALYYIGGIIKHGHALNAFANSTTNSYKRLVPGYEAPVFLAYSEKNRSAAIRIPYGAGVKAKRIETRFPDPLSNPYLLLSAFLMAGLDGIKNKIHPGSMINENLYEASPETQANTPKVAKNLREALIALSDDCDFLKQGGVFTDDMIASYIAIKQAEISKVQVTPNPMEYKLYYSS